MSEQKRPKIYAVDFDGTLCENKWPDIGEPKTDVVEFVREIQRRGDKWILWTMRTSDKLLAAVRWLDKLGLDPDAVNDNLLELQFEYKTNPRKVYADIYIDDHNAGGLVLPPFED